MLSPMATEDKNKWMSEVVVLTNGGSILRGEYGGYMNVDGRDFVDDAFGAGVDCWHRHCWELAGKPTEFANESRDSNDQGWFFADGVHNIDPPTKLPDAPAPPARHTILGDMNAPGTNKVD